MLSQTYCCTCSGEQRCFVKKKKKKKKSFFWAKPRRNETALKVKALSFHFRGAELTWRHTGIVNMTAVLAVK